MKILFQGDSVTDADRDRSDPHDLGQGYPKYAAAMIREFFPNMEFEFINQGISGDRTGNVLSRMETDIIDFQPDIVSLMIGINDVWWRVLSIEETDQSFEQNITAILEGIKTRTNAKILLIQPFLLDVEDKRALRGDLNGKQAIVLRLAEKYADAYLAVDDLFAEKAPDPAIYASDGVHPSTEGARFIAKCYLEAVTPLIEAVAAAGETLE